MKITIRVKPGSRRERIEVAPDGTLMVKVRATALEGRANQAVLEAIANHYGVPKSCVAIIRGEKSRTKVIEVHE